LVPSFAKDMILRVKIGTQEDQSGIKELKRTEWRLPEVETLLRRHVLSAGLWNLDVVRDSELDLWRWTPPSGGKFELCVARPGGEGLRWAVRTTLVSIPRIEITTPRSKFRSSQSRGEQL
jgi:hypothetical protein